MIATKYEEINGKFYVQAADYDTVMYELKRANEQIASQQKTINKLQKAIISEMPREEADIQKLKAEIAFLQGQKETFGKILDRILERMQ